MKRAWACAYSENPCGLMNRSTGLVAAEVVDARQYFHQTYEAPDVREVRRTLVEEDTRRYWLLRITWATRLPWIVLLLKST